ncbi:hypothetical protein K474DRAFT_1681028, partial [Panus rudis PR-1116 ss-1]
MGPPLEVPDRTMNALPRHFPPGSSGPATRKEQVDWEKRAGAIRTQKPKSHRFHQDPLNGQHGRDRRALLTLEKEGAPSTEIAKLRDQIAIDAADAKRRRMKAVEQQKLNKARAKIEGKEYVFLVVDPTLEAKKLRCHAGGRCTKAGGGTRPPALLKLREVVLARQLPGGVRLNETIPATTVYYHARCLTNAQCRKLRKDDPNLTKLVMDSVPKPSIKAIKSRIQNTPDGPGHEETAHTYISRVKKMVPSNNYRRHAYEILHRKLHLARQRVEEAQASLQEMYSSAYVQEQMNGAWKETRDEVLALYKIDL